MYDWKYVIPGILLFLLAGSLPFWGNLLAGTRDYVAPELRLPSDATSCVESVEFMRSRHMQLLTQWRDAATRQGMRTYAASTGREWGMSLQNTCMGCHTDKVKFCDACHAAYAVSPACWSCHLAPKGAVP